MRLVIDKRAAAVRTGNVVSLLRVARHILSSLDVGDGYVDGSHLSPV